MRTRIKFTALWLTLTFILAPLCLVPLLWVGAITIGPLPFSIFMESSEKIAQYYTIVVSMFSLVISAKVATKIVVMYLNRKMKLSFEEISSLIGQDVLDFSGCQKKDK